MLQSEGLVEAEPQRRARVAAFDTDHLESVYAQRILLEGMSARLTVPALDDDQHVELYRLIEAMAATEAQEDLGAWGRAHREFHALLVSGANDPMRIAMGGLMEDAERYLLAARQVVAGRSQPPQPIRDPQSARNEHQEIYEAYVSRDGDLAARMLADHLARTALSILAHAAPRHDPATVREALLLVSR